MPDVNKSLRRKHEVPQRELRAPKLCHSIAVGHPCAPGTQHQLILHGSEKTRASPRTALKGLSLLAPHPSRIATTGSSIPNHTTMEIASFRGQETSQPAKKTSADYTAGVQNNASCFRLQKSLRTRKANPSDRGTAVCLSRLSSL